MNRQTLIQEQIMNINSLMPITRVNDFKAGLAINPIKKQVKNLNKSLEFFKLVDELKILCENLIPVEVSVITSCVEQFHIDGYKKIKEFGGKLHIKCQIDTCYDEFEKESKKYKSFKHVSTGVFGCEESEAVEVIKDEIKFLQQHIKKLRAKPVFV